jgi:hypothetical protein
MTQPLPKKKLPWWAGLLIVFGVLMLFAGLVIGGIVWWFVSNKDRLVAESEESTSEAVAFADSHDQNACVDEAIRRLSSCHGLLCETQAKVFLTTCLEEAQETPGFCDGVPRSSEIVKATLWLSDECKRRGKPNNQRCSRLLQAVTQECGSLEEP